MNLASYLLRDFAALESRRHNCRVSIAHSISGRWLHVRLGCVGLISARAFAPRQGLQFPNQKELKKPEAPTPFPCRLGSALL